MIEELAEPSRRQLLLAMRSGPQSVSDLVRETGMKQPNVSNHLAKLKAKGLVRATKVGRQVFYGLDGPLVEAALLQMTSRGDRDTPEPLRLDEIAKQFAKAAIAGDEATCVRLIDQLMDHPVKLVEIYQQVIGEAMSYIGRWYDVEAIDVGQEHIASAITERMMARVVHYAPALRSTGKTALIGCVEGNWHSIGPRMISDYLRLNGWRTFFLGASVPADSFVSRIDEHRPDLVLVSVAIDANRQESLRCIRSISDWRQAHSTEFELLVGGMITASSQDDLIAAGADRVVVDLGSFALLASTLGGD